MRIIVNVAEGVSALKDRVVTIAVVGLATVVVALIITWVLWPQEQAVVSSGQPVRASEPAAVTGFTVCEPGWPRSRAGTIAFSGQLVVWSLDSGAGSSLMGSDIRLHRPFRIILGRKGVSLRQPMLDGHLLVWQQRGSKDPTGTTSLWMMDLRDREPVRISDPALIDDVDVSLGQVVWLERGQKDSSQSDLIKLFDVAEGTVRRIPAAKGRKTDVALDQGMIAWSAAEGGPDAIGIWLYQPLSGSRLRIVDRPSECVDLSDTYLVWAGVSGGVRSYDLTTGKRRLISDISSSPSDCRIDGSLAVWWDAGASADDVHGVGGNAYGADLRSGRLFPLATHRSVQQAPQVSGQIVVWPDDGRGLWVIRGVVVSSS